MYYVYKCVMYVCICVFMCACSYGVPALEFIGVNISSPGIFTVCAHNGLHSLAVAFFGLSPSAF